MYMLCLAKFVKITPVMPVKQQWEFYLNILFFNPNIILIMLLGSELSMWGGFDRIFAHS